MMKEPGIKRCNALFYLVQKSEYMLITGKKGSIIAQALEADDAFALWSIGSAR